MERRAIQAVVGVIRRGDRVLVIQRGPGVTFTGYWTLPSGKIEPGESQRDAVIREMQEELGLKVSPIAKVWECPTDDGAFTLHWWSVSEGGGQLTPEPAEVADVRWVTAADFEALEHVFEGDRTFLREVLPRLSARSQTAPG